MFRLRCTSCRTVFTIRPCEPGQVTACPSCGLLMRVPRPPQPQVSAVKAQTEQVATALIGEATEQVTTGLPEFEALPLCDTDRVAHDRSKTGPVLIAVATVACGCMVLVAVLLVSHAWLSPPASENKAKARITDRAYGKLPLPGELVPLEAPRPISVTTALKPLPPFEPEDEPVPLPLPPTKTAPPPVSESPPTETVVKPSSADPSVETFTKAIEANPKDAAAYYGRGKAYLAKGDFERAIDDLNQAIQLDSHLSDAYKQRDLAYRARLKAGPIPGYKYETIEGFHVLVGNAVISHNDDEGYERKPMDVLKGELATVVKVLPRRSVRALQTILIWVEWHDDKDPDLEKGVLAKFYGSSGDKVLWGLAKHKHPLKANSVEILSMKSLTAEHQPSVKVQRCVILHELAHAVHFLLIGNNNLQIKLAYQQAMDRRLYDSSRNANGDPVKPYARANEYEYFAELSCAFHDKLAYFPFTRAELEKYDPVGYRVMELAWGEAGGKAAKETKPNGPK